MTAAVAIAVLLLLLPLLQFIPATGRHQQGATLQLPTQHCNMQVSTSCWHWLEAQLSWHGGAAAIGAAFPAVLV